MTPRSVTWIDGLALGLLAALSAILAVGWWSGHRAQVEELRAFESRNDALLSLDTAGSLRAHNHALMHVIDESYTLMYDAGIHIQLDLKTDKDGRLRLSADSAKLSRELKAKLRTR